MLNGRGEGIQAHLLSHMKDCQGEDRSSGSFISTCACCVCRASVSKTHFPLHPSSAATSCCALGKSAHLALMYDSNQAGAEPWRSVTRTRGSFSSSSSPALHWLLYWLRVTSKVRTESLKIKKKLTTATQSLRSHPAFSSSASPCLLTHRALWGRWEKVTLVLPSSVNFHFFRTKVTPVRYHI